TVPEPDICINGPMLALPVAKMTSGARATNSATDLRILASSPPDQRASIRILRPSVQPNCCKPCRKAAMRACPWLPSSVISTPMRRCPSRCCAYVVIGHAAAPPIRAMNSRRLIAAPEARTGHRTNAHLNSGRGQQCPLWVISGHQGQLNECPLYPQKRTFVAAPILSAKCQKQIHTDV